MLAAAVGFFISVALLIFVDHTWFNLDEPDPPAWHEISRLLAGPIAAALVCAITLPATGARTAGGRHWSSRCGR